jgi:hypothetical protein
MQFEKYYNPVHGLELQPDVNKGNRQNEFGVVFLATLIYLCSGRESLPFYKIDLLDLFDLLEEENGLFNRGALDNRIASETGIEKRTISHDNISAISSLSYFYNTRHARDIYIYGLKHFFSYNNLQKGFRLPMNGGNYSVWSRLGGSTIFYLLFLPWYAINFFISNAKEPNQTSGKLLNFVELYPLKNDKVFGIFWRIYISKMKSMYGEFFMEELTKIYYQDENHPCRLASKGVKFD